MSFINKVVLITGASSGIGADAARHFARLGAKVVLVGRNEKRLNDVVAEIERTRCPPTFIIVADITKDAQRVIDEAVTHFGKLDVLVNAAGITIPKKMMDSSIEEFDQMMNTNVRALITLTKLAVPHLANTNGNVVNVSSVAGLVPVPLVPFYSMTKTAVNHFTQLAAIEFGPKQIRVNAINPGVVETPLFETAGLTAGQRAKINEEHIARYPIGRIGRVEDTSNAIAFLASDASSFITGTLLRVDGGAISAAAY